MMGNSIIIGNEGDNLADTLRQMSETMLLISQRLSEDTAAIDRKVTDVKDSFAAELESVRKDFATDIEEVKDSQYLDPYQAHRVQEAAKLRAFELLKIKWVDGGAAPESQHDYKLYFGKFVRLIHNDARKVGLEGNKIVYTPKRNYGLLLEFIGKWNPPRGVEGQKAYYDELASIR